MKIKAIRLPEKMLSALVVKAQKNGRTVSGEIRFALAKYLGLKK